MNAAGVRNVEHAPFQLSLKVVLLVPAPKKFDLAMLVVAARTVF